MAIRDMVARHSNFDDTKDFIPTPPWATRAVFEEVWPDLKNAKDQTYWDPACGAGHMTRVFKEYGAFDLGTDLHNHVGADNFQPYDFTLKKRPVNVEAIITNPPYAKANDFVMKGMMQADRVLALLMRIQVLESETRYSAVYKRCPPSKVAVFSERIPFKTGEVIRKAPKMFTHCWLVWDIKSIREKGRYNLPPCELSWIEPGAQRKYEKDSDYGL